MKQDHESWVANTLGSSISEVEFAELEVAAKAIMTSATLQEAASFSLTGLEPKMKKNKLTNKTRDYFTMGLSRASEVRQYIEEASKLDADFPDRLKAGFREEYNRLVNQNILSDDLFMSMFAFASGGELNDFKRQAAGLAILVHLFEICEVFER